MFIKRYIVFGIAFVVGKLGKEFINRINLDFTGLYPVIVIALMFFTFSFTEFLGGNGFLSIYLTAIYLGNQYLIHKKTITQVLRNCMAHADCAFPYTGIAGLPESYSTGSGHRTPRFCISDACFAAL
jgi:NhaP-type Na+/H+ and K+/H+ antiporter